MTDAATVDKPVAKGGAHRPRKPWVVGLLVACTLGLYMFRLIYVHARTVRNLGIKTTHPLGWTLVSVIPLALLFVVSNLAAHYETLAEKRQLRIQIPGALIGGAATLVIIAMRLYNQFGTGGEGFIIPAGLIALGALFAWFEAGANQFLNVLTEAELSQETRGVFALRTVATVVCILPGLALIGLLAVDEVRQSLRSQIPAGSTWEHPDGRYSLTFADTWRVADIGTYSDGTADAEFVYSQFETVVVFDQQTVGFDEALSWRRRSIMEQYPNASCGERRYLRTDGITRVGEMRCETEFAGDPQLFVSTSVENADQHVELFADLMTTRHQRAESLRRFTTLSRTLQLHDLDNDDNANRKK